METRTAYRIFREERQRHKLEDRHRWEDNIKTIARNRVEWIGFVWPRTGTSGGFL
jgi:hypothetical protein